MTLIEKKQGGHRGIGKLTGLYRIWSKARRPYAAAWEAENERTFFAASAGVGPTDAVYRQALRQEAACASGQEAVTLLEDMEAFYESVDRGELVKEALELKFPLCIVRASLAAYAGPRMLTMDGKASKEVYPRRGIIAGCSFATTYTKLFYTRKFDKLKSKLPQGVSIDVYIDDIAINIESSSDDIVSKAIVAREMLIDCLTTELGCKVAHGKSCIVSSSSKVARRIANHFGIEQAVKRCAPNLGIDATAGGKRNRIKADAKRTSRFRRGKLRGKKLHAVAKAVGDKAVKIFTVGIAPEMNFGAEVWGVSDSEAIRLKRVAAMAMKPRSRCRSLTALHLFHGLPTIKEEIRTVVHYAKQVWRAMTAREKAADRDMGLPTIRQRWEEAYAGIEATVEAYIAADNGSGRGDTTQKAKKAWKEVRGPIGAAALTLARYGWRFKSAFVLLNPEGEEVSLTTNSPAMVKMMLKDAALDNYERKIGEKWQTEDESFRGRRICPDIVRKVANNGSRHGLTALQAGALRAAFCEGIYTRERALHNGYDVENVCAKCGARGDSVHHRTYKCPATRSTVLQYVPRWLYEEGARAAPSEKFWVTGAFPHPADDWPTPQREFTAKWHRCDDEDGCDGDEADDDDRFGGFIYIDGSCVPNDIRGLARASCSGVQVNGDGRMKRAVTMPIPKGLPQTSQASEFVALGTIRQLLEKRTNIRADCMNVVKTANAAASKALAANRVYAGIALDAWARPHLSGLVDDIKWVPSHRKETGMEDAETKRDIRGNAEADKYAGNAIADHPQPSAAQKASLDFYCKRAPLVCKALAAALPLFPAAEETRMHRRPKPKDKQEAIDKKLHWWIHEENAWRCQVCGTWATGGEVTAKMNAARCDGHIAEGRAKRWTELGHKIAVARGAYPFAFCVRCGAWGSRRAYNLSIECKEPSAAGKAALKRIAEGWHPWRKKLAKGGDAPRTHVQVVAAYQKERDAWQGLRTDTANEEGAEGWGAEGTTAEQPSAAAARLPPANTRKKTEYDGEDAMQLNQYDDAYDYEVDIAEEYPARSCFEQHRSDDEDPMGHGGSFDQPPEEPAGRQTDSGRGRAAEYQKDKHEEVKRRRTEAARPDGGTATTSQRKKA